MIPHFFMEFVRDKKIMVLPFNKIKADDNDMKYQELTHKIISCAMEVHRHMSNGFQACLPKGSLACRQEVVYQRPLAIEMEM